MNELARWHAIAAIVTLPIWIGPFLWDVLRTPPRRWT
jgi:hypothetical protein